jgi:ribonuclease III
MFEFRDRTLLETALTHRSYVNEHPEMSGDNERLEFLGDAVLNFLAGEFLYKRYPDKPEGQLTPLRSALVDERQLAQFAIALNLGPMMRLGRGAEMNGGRSNPNLLSSTFEALVGAYFLDVGSDMEKVRAYVTPLFTLVIDNLADTAVQVNYKSRFQEWALANTGQNPSYVIVAQSGPDHARQFTAEVKVGSKKYGTGQGNRKQDAEKDAARQALAKLELL